MRRFLTSIVVCFYILATSTLFHNFSMGHSVHNHSHGVHTTSTAMHAAHDTVAKEQLCDEWNACESVCVQIAYQEATTYTTHTPIIKSVVYYSNFLVVADTTSLYIDSIYEHKQLQIPIAGLSSITSQRLII